MMIARSPPLPSRILGAVLAGGRSSRFGSDKAQARWHGRALVDHAAALIAPHVDEVIVVGGDGDLPAPGLGPLGGIAAALDRAASEGFTSVLTIACDMPRVAAPLLTALLRRAPAFCVEAPVLGHWPAALRTQLIDWLAADDRSMVAWAHAIGALPIVAGAPIANVNTREDLLAL